MADAKTWVTGEVIEAGPLNDLEQRAAQALNLAQTNEKDIGSVQGVVDAITTNDTEPKIDGEKIADKTVGGDKFKEINIWTQSTADDIPNSYVSYVTNSAGASSSLGVALVSFATIMGNALAYDSTYKKINVNYGNGLSVNATTNMLEVPVDGTTIGYGSSGLHVINSSAAKTRQAATVPTTLAGLAVSHLNAEPDGTIAEGVFDLTNGTANPVTIKAETAFATGLALAAKEQTYSCLTFVTGEPLTLEVNATGKSINFTTDVTVPANGTLHIYVRDNNG